MNWQFKTLLQYKPKHPWDFRCGHIAGVFKGNSLIAFGFNRKKVHPFQLQYRCRESRIFVHAEIEAIYKALQRISLRELSKTTMVVIRVGRSSDELLPSKPCSGCMAAIVEFGISRLLHS